jgi:cell division protein FtsN
MFRLRILFGLLISCASMPAFGQGSARTVDPAFVRAQALVSDGNGAAGRAVIDSVLAATPTNAPLYAQGLFWRATLASNAADAESDYKHIVVDYPLAPQAEDALLRLAQLELARGDRDGALGHLQRIPRDYPRSKSLARASYWTARVLFEKNDIPNACAANANAISQVGADEIELRNQIQYQGQRCPATATLALSSQSKTTDSSTLPAPTPTKPAPTMGGGSSSATRTPTDSLGRKAPASDSAAAPLASKEAATAVGEPARPKLSVDAKDSATSVAVPVKKPVALPSKAPSTGNAPNRGAEYTVQVAAYNHKPDAEKLVASLVKRGYQARVDGDIVPYRVRIGRYSTEREAEDALKKIKSKHMDGFVARAPKR